MFVLDTNVLSALMSPSPAPKVTRWVARQPRRLLFTTAISQAEILASIAVLPEGRSRQALAGAAHAMFEEDFAGRVLPFQAAAAAAYADIFAARQHAGQPIAPLDLMIAAVARARDASVVTRDGSGFAGCGVPVIDPWTAA